MNSPPKNSATWLRRSRRHASVHGPSPGGSFSPSALKRGGDVAGELGAGCEVVAIAIGWAGTA